MTRIEGRTTFARTPQDVFDFLVDPRNEPSYNSLIVSARKVTPGRIGPGTRFVQQTKRFGRVSDVTIDLVDHDRPHHLSWHITSSGMDVHGDEYLSAEGDHTQVHWVWDFASRGPLRIFGPLIGLAGRRIEHRVWADLKRTLDSAGPDTRHGATGTWPAPRASTAAPAGDVRLCPAAPDRPSVPDR